MFMLEYVDSVGNLREDAMSNKESSRSERAEDEPAYIFLFLRMELIIMIAHELELLASSFSTPTHNSSISPPS